MPTVTTTYSVESEDRVRLEALIGDGQSGGSSVYLGKRLVASGDEIRDHDLGAGADLRGEVLVVQSVVLDIRPEHDKTSVHVRLEGGHPPELPIVQTATARPGGAVGYLTVVEFK